MNIFNKINQKTYEAINNGGLLPILILGGIGIILCLIWLVLLFLIYGFNWLLIFDLAVVCFCGWAIYQVVRLMTKNFDIFKKPLGMR